jgi:hypothetical protein
MSKMSKGIVGETNKEAEGFDIIGMNSEELVGRVERYPKQIGGFKMGKGLMSQMHLKTFRHSTINQKRSKYVKDYL